MNDFTPKNSTAVCEPPQTADGRQQGTLNPGSVCIRCAFRMSDGKCLCESENYGSADGCRYYAKRVSAEQ
ncbi:MAG: hypothetical protein Q4F31_09375 [Eubacteriales bacterium]|nr:hypothetical protein [Eubacteriales bacterium]